MAGCGTSSPHQRDLAPLVAPITAASAVGVAASQPLLPDGIDEATVEALCGGWCDKEAFVATSHDRLGLGRFVWLFSPVGGAVGPVYVVDGEVRWSLPVGDPSAHVRRSAVDALGHVFFQLQLGDGTQQVVVLVPTEQGFTDMHTLDRAGPWHALLASFVDDGQGRFDVDVDLGSGPVRYRWRGDAYITE